MDNVYVYYVKFPEGIKEAVVPCLEGHTIYIDERLFALLPILGLANYRISDYTERATRQ